ncbi:MAG: radical SAM protein [Candidatus Aenigmarchaeota archaeon]|nr:radical SAM protein [Candidatus Aenigmarchaeota archaeon]
MKDEVIGRLERWMKGERQPPFEAEIWPTGRCNLNCVYCRPSGSKKEELPPKKIFKVVGDCVSLGVKHFSFGGGEPFIRRKLALSLMRYIKTNGLSGSVITNGTLFTPNDIRELIQIGWDEIIISLDGPDASTNDFQRDKGTFKKVVKAIRTFKHEKEREASDSPHVSINMVLTNRNYKKLPEMIELIHNLGCDSLILQSLMQITTRCKELKMNKEQTMELRDIIMEAHSLAKDFEIRSNMLHFIQSEYIEKADDVPKLLTKDLKEKTGFLGAPCYQPWFKIMIGQRGEVGPCGSLATDSPLNVRAHKLNEIWFGDFFDRLRESMLQKEVPKECRACCTQKIIENEIIREKLENIK